MTPESYELKEHGLRIRENPVPSTRSSVIQRPKGKPRFATFWCTAHRQAREDLRTRGWQGAIWVLCYVVFIGLVYVFAVLSTLSSAGSVITSRLTAITACAPDGEFYTNPDDFSFWHASGFFQITLSHGELTFTQAKVVDVIWDVVVGRGGQALLTLVSWNVFTKYVTTSMQVAPVTFSTFRTIFIHGDATIVGVWRLLRDFSRKHGLQSRVAMTFMIATMVLILLFPTFASAMTGYSANVEPFVQGGTGYIPFTNLRPLYYVIWDGDRIGKGKNYKVMDLNYGEEPVYTSTWPLEYCIPRTTAVGAEVEFCQMVSTVTDYVAKWESGGQDSSSSFLNYTLPPPTLNITMYSLPRDYTHYQRRDSKDVKWFSDPNRMAWVGEADKQIYNATELKKTGQCQPTKTYNWGFSFIQVILMITLLVVWLIGTYTMYLHSHNTLKKRQRPEIFGEYKAIFALSDAIQINLIQHSGSEDIKDASHLTESQVRHRITTDLNGGSISFISDSQLDRMGPTWRFRHVFKRDAWWILFLFLATPSAIWCGFMPYLAASVIFLPLPVLFAMYVRTTGKSGFVLVFWPVCVLAVMQMFMLMMVITGSTPGGRF